MYDFISGKQNPETIFEKVLKLGQGNYGYVYKVKNKKDQKYYAAKISKIISGIDCLKKEIKILEQCNNSDFILKYYGSYINNDEIWIILEFCEGGSVQDLIRVMNNNLNEEQIASIIFMALKGLSYLHEQKKLHRDIKAGNIMLKKNGMVKLGDFGVSAQLMHSFSKKDSKIGTPYWMSPEVISQNKYDFKCDIWSLGITCIEFAEGQPPFSEIRPFMAMKKILSNPPKGLSNPKLWSSEFNDFVSKCLIFDPEKRPSAKDLLNHKFISKFNKGNKIIETLINKYKDKLERFRVNETTNEGKEEEVEEDFNFDTVLIKEDNVEEGEEGLGTMIVKAENEINKNEDNKETLKESKSSKKMPDFDYMNLINKFSIDGINYKGINNKSRRIREKRLSLDIDNENFDNGKDNTINEFNDLDEKESIGQGIKSKGKQKNKSESEIMNIKKEDKFSEEQIDLLADDEEINEKNLGELIINLASLENQMNREIKLIKEKYESKISKHKTSIAFLKKNSHLKNLKELSEFKKFSNKIKCFNTQNLDEASANTNSVYIMNPIKIAEYQSNNIKSINKNNQI